MSQIVGYHQMKTISLAGGGEYEDYSLVSYVGKNERNTRGRSPSWRGLGGFSGALLPSYLVMALTSLCSLADWPVGRRRVTLLRLQRACRRCSHYDWTGNPPLFAGYTVTHPPSCWIHCLPAAFVLIKSFPSHVSHPIPLRRRLGSPVSASSEKQQR